ncbi:hypothetical protein ACS0TY_035313 [Phlomoides rotata]
MMEHANTNQVTPGVHFRLRARAFIVAEPQGNRVIFVKLDACMASQCVTIKGHERLKARLLLLIEESRCIRFIIFIQLNIGYVK